VLNFYLSINIRFTQATTRGDDTKLIKPFGSSNTCCIFQYLFFMYLVSTGDIPALAHRKLRILLGQREGRGEESAARSKMADKPKKWAWASEVNRTAKKRPFRLTEGLLSKRESDKGRRLCRVCNWCRFSLMESPEGGDWPEVLHRCCPG